MFKDPQSLADIYPPLVQRAMTHFKSPDVMRCLGKEAHGCFTGELVTSFKNRPEGVRVKHWVGSSASSSCRSCERFTTNHTAVKAAPSVARLSTEAASTNRPRRPTRARI
jgi:hypothetical protein